MAGSPKGGFPARRPGKLFGKKQMVMFGCIVLVLFVNLLIAIFNAQYAQVKMGVVSQQPILTAHPLLSSP